MPAQIALEKYFKYDISIGRLKRLQPSPKTPVVELIYPVSKQLTYPKSRVGREDLPSAVKNFPVIVRGSASYAVPSSKTGIDGYEPFPVEVTCEVSDAVLNDLRNLTEDDVNSFIDLKVARLKDGCKLTAEALAIQSLTGQISYAAQVSPGSFTTYEANFGSIKKYIPAKKWNASGVKFSDIFQNFSDISDKLGESGFDSNVAFLCGSKAFGSLIDVASDIASNKIDIKVTQNEIVLPGFRCIRASGKYYDYQKKQYVKGVDEKKVVGVGLDAPFWFPFCSLDNAEANFKALPFWASVKRSITGKGYTVQGETKPFPVPIVEAICEAIVVD